MKGLFIITLLFWKITFAQSPDWGWARNAAGSGTSYSAGITTDASGNVYVTGNFSGQITFGSYTLTNGSDSTDIFVLKYDSLGNVVWAKSFGGTGNDASNGISSDGNGNIYITGYFTSPAIVFGNDTLVNNGVLGNPLLFILKCNSTGTVLWARSVGGTGISEGKAVSADGSSNVYITGFSISDTIVFGADTIISPGNDQILVVKYNSAGDVQWVERTEASGLYSTGKAISTDNNGNVYLTGYFTSDSIIFGNDTVAKSGAGYMFTVKYDSLGVVKWAKSSENAISGSGSGIGSDENGNVYVTGYFDNDTAVFGNDTLIRGFFVLKYDSSGGIIWANGIDPNLAGYGTASAAGLKLDANEAIYITGTYYLGSIGFGTDTLNHVGRSDFFIVKYDTTGNVIWAKGTGGTGFTTAGGISIDNKENILVTGSLITDTTVFGSDTLSDTSENIFVAKLSNTTTGIDHITAPTQHLTIYPNPAQNQATIEWQPTGEPPAYLAIYDLLGRQISDQQVDGASGQALLNTSALDNGLYVVKLYLGNGRVMSGKLAVGR